MILLNFAVNQQKCVDKVLKTPAKSNSMIEKNLPRINNFPANCVSVSTMDVFCAKKTTSYLKM